MRLRTKPYKDVRRARCIKCGKPAEVYWETCAAGARQIPLCMRHDVELNEVALSFVIGKREAKRYVDRYRARHLP